MNGGGGGWTRSRIGTYDEVPIHKLVVCGGGGVGSGDCSGDVDVYARTLDREGGKEEQRQDSKAKSSIGGGIGGRSRKSSAVFYAVADRRRFNIARVRTPELRTCEEPAPFLVRQTPTTGRPVRLLPVQ